MTSFTNISTYKFAPLSNLKKRRLKLQERCKEWKTKGTILLSTEGINLFVAGTRESIDALLAELRSIPGLEDLTPKFSESTHQPFQRMLIRIKKEIIAFGVDTIKPSEYTSRKISPKTLKSWLDEGRPMTLLDTRNDYEIKLGTFENALPIGIDHFREFPKAVSELPERLRETPVVMFCTGGIRCEKAGPYMESQGFKTVFQLDGGILKYFEECADAHYQGNCFVFDRRVGLDPTLHETEDLQCFACLTPLKPEDQSDPRYEKGISCRFCFKSSEQKLQETLAERHRALSKATNPLPGSIPYNQKRPMKIPASYDGRTIRSFLLGVLKHVSPAYWEEELSNGRIVGPDFHPVTGEKRITAGERYYCLTPNQSEPPVNTDIKILYEDEAIIVLEKPAPLPVHACGRYNRNTLKFILSQVYAPQFPHLAHRLDADTTGIMIAARTRHFAGLLQPQFFRGEVEKRYLARVEGHPIEDEFSCDLPVSDELNEDGTRSGHPDGLTTKTEFRVLKRFTDGTALLEVNPLTGRTNQIRIHLWELGFPIHGDQRYLKNRQIGDIQTSTPNDKPLLLHAKKITFTHPLTSERVTFETTNEPELLRRIVKYCENVRAIHRP